MMAQLQEAIAADLSADRACSLFTLSRLYPMIPSGDLRQSFIHLYQQHQSQYDLLCHLVVSQESQLRTQLELFSHIKAGYLIDHDWKVEEFVVLAILPKDMPIQEATQHLEMPQATKRQPYHNKFLEPAQIKMCVTSSRDHIKPKEQKAKPIPPAKKEEDSKPKTAGPKRELQVKEEIKVKPLTQPALRERKETPVTTQLESVRQKVEEERMIKPPTRGMQIESDEEYYDKDKFNRAMELEDKARETDGSGKKEEPMEVEAIERVKDRKFIAESEDEDDAFFDQLQQTKKATPPVQAPPQPAASKPMASQPVQSQSQSKPKPMVAMKGGLAGWLKGSK